MKRTGIFRIYYNISVNGEIFARDLDFKAHSCIEAINMFYQEARKHQWDEEYRITRIEEITP